MQPFSWERKLFGAAFFLGRDNGLGLSFPPRPFGERAGVRGKG
ncbi:hypothetical protein LEADMM068B1_10015 [Leclercia adecarboxylata]